MAELYPATVHRKISLIMHNDKGEYMSSKMCKCPVCGTLNDDYWPLNIDGDFTDCGCQSCWEKGPTHTKRWKKNQQDLYERSKWFGVSSNNYKELREMNQQ